MTNNPNAFVSVPREPSDEQLKFYGYAPGDYASQCIRGGHIVEGLDKRATCCLSCARAAYKKFIDNFVAAPSAPVVSADWMKAAAAEISDYAEDELVDAESLSNPRVASIIAKHAPVVLGEEWLPIETAPFGEVVLICNPDKGRLQCVAVYSKTANIWRVANTLTPIDVPPTHWRPLPAPPGQSPSAVSGEEELRKALGEIEQAFREINHAFHSGPEWYTRGEHGLRQQVRMWLDRGVAAASRIDAALKQGGDRG